MFDEFSVGRQLCRSVEQRAIGRMAEVEHHVFGEVEKRRVTDGDIGKLGCTAKIAQGLSVVADPVVGGAIRGQKTRVLFKGGIIPSTGSRLVDVFDPRLESLESFALEAHTNIPCGATVHVGGVLAQGNVRARVHPCKPWMPEHDVRGAMEHVFPHFVRAKSQQAKKQMLLLSSIPATASQQIGIVVA